MSQSVRLCGGVYVWTACWAMLSMIGAGRELIEEWGGDEEELYLADGYNLF